jgi:hypothetical protein
MTAIYDEVAGLVPLARIITSTFETVGSFSKPLAEDIGGDVRRLEAVRAAGDPPIRTVLGEITAKQTRGTVCRDGS